MKYTRLSPSISMVFIFVFAAAFLFYIAPRQAMGANIVTYGSLVPDADTRSCSATGNTTFRCRYLGTGDYDLSWVSSSLSTPLCIVAYPVTSTEPDTGVPVCLTSMPYCSAPPKPSQCKVPPSECPRDNYCSVVIDCRGQSVTFDQPTNSYPVSPLPVDATLTVICVQ